MNYKNQKFKCSQCGACCRNLDKNSDLISYHNGDGICKYLNTEKNLCSIYEERPIFCRVDEGYKFFKNELTLEEYYQKNKEMCEVLNYELK